MKIKVSDVPVGSCFLRGRKVTKKIGDSLCASVGKRGKIRRGKCPDQSSAKTTLCPISLLGAALGNPSRPLVEMGAALPWEGRRGKKK